MAKRIPVDELHSPFDNTYYASKDAKDGICNPTGSTALAGCLRPNNTAHLLQKLNEGYYKTSKTDRAEAVGECSLGSATSSSFREVVWREVPRPIDTSDDGVNGVL